MTQCSGKINKKMICGKIKETFWLISQEKFGNNNTIISYNPKRGDGMKRTYQHRQIKKKKDKE